jgi:hypothetical protein
MVSNVIAHDVMSSPPPKVGIEKPHLPPFGLVSLLKPLPWRTQSVKLQTWSMSSARQRRLTFRERPWKSISRPTQGSSILFVTFLEVGTLVTLYFESTSEFAPRGTHDSSLNLLRWYRVMSPNIQIKIKSIGKVNFDHHKSFDNLIEPE